MRSKYFKIKELVPPNLYSIVHEDILWDIMDNRLIESIDKLKEIFNEGSITINNYAWNGDRTQSGLRTKDSKYYSGGSMHSIGKAVDMLFSAYDVGEVREYILSHQEEFPYVGGLEKASWLHMDTRPRRDGKIFLFDTKGMKVSY